MSVASKSVSIAQLYILMSSMLTVVCCWWTFSDYLNGNQTMFFYSATAAILMALILIGLFLELREVSHSCLNLLRVKGLGFRLVHIVCSIIFIFSVSTAAVNLYEPGTNKALQVISAFIFLVQLLFLIFCIPCNGVQVALYNKLEGSVQNALNNQFGCTTYMWRDAPAPG